MICDETELALLALPPDMNYLVVEPHTPVVAEDAATIAAHHRIIRFKGCVMIEVHEPYTHFVPLTREHFTQIANPLIGWAKQSHINGVFDHLSYIAQDLSDNDHLLLFGNLADTNADLTVWDMETLEVRSDIAPEDCVRRSPYSMKSHASGPIPFIMSIAGNNPSLYDDIMQSVAPLLMTKKPEGVIWWIGVEDSGKSTLMEALFRIFPDQLASITMKRLTGGRAMQYLNGNLGNIAECDNGQVGDVEMYRNIAKHQNFNVHKYHSQNGLEVQGNIHHIFSTTNAPTFSKKNWSAQWRTFTIPFSQQIESAMTGTLTDEFFGQLISEMCHYAVQIKHQGYRYEWSAAALAARTDYPVKRKLDVVRCRPNPTPFPW